MTQEYIQEIQIEFIKSAMTFLKGKGMSTEQAKEYLANNTATMFKKYMEIRIQNSPSVEDLMNVLA